MDRALSWADEIPLRVDHEVIIAAAFLHDIKGLGASGQVVRRIHHLKGAKAAKTVLTYLEWNTQRIDLVTDCITGHRGATYDYNIKNYPDGFMDPEPDPSDINQVRKPKPVSSEARLIRDADTFQELDGERIYYMEIHFRENTGNQKSMQKTTGTPQPHIFSILNI